MADLARPLLLIPVGTQVVARVEVRTSTGVHPAGAVGVVIDAPAEATHSYRVRFPDGTDAMLRRSELSIRKHVQAGSLIDPPEMEEWNLHHYVIYRCVVGSHAFGLSRPESDIDRRGIYLPPAALHWSLYGVPEQLETRERDEVYWELQKFLVLALKANPNVLECLHTPLVEFVTLEQLYSPLVVCTTPEHEELRAIAHGCITRRHVKQYLGFAHTQWELFLKDRRIKPLLYTYRVLLTGVHLMRTGEVEANLVRLNEEFRLPQLPELIDRKVNGTERERLNDENIEAHRREFERLLAMLEEAGDASALPESPTCFKALNDLLIRLHLNSPPMTAR